MRRDALTVDTGNNEVYSNLYWILTIYDIILSVLTIISIAFAFEAVWTKCKPRLLIPWLIAIKLGIISGIVWFLQLLMAKIYVFFSPPICGIGT